MPDKTKIMGREQVVRAALTLAGERGWAVLTLADIAQAGGLSLADLHDRFEDKADILTAFGRMIDRRVLEDISAGEGASTRDRLFDILMERLEVLNDFRPGFVAVLESLRGDPKQALIGLPHLCRSMTWMLEAAGDDTSGLRGALKVAGLTALYLRVLHVWAEDESADLSKTMAALDRDLGRAEGWVNNISF